MNFQKFLGLAFCGAMLGGCAIHPVQQDVTRLPTAQIVRQIRCETRFSILEKAAQLLEHQRFADTTEGYTLRQKSLNLAHRLRESGDHKINTKSIRKGLDKPEKAFYDTYINTAIAHLFVFDIAEQNVIGAQVNPIQMLTAGGLAGIQLGASADFSRSNVRTFAIVETFEELLEDTDLTCQDYYPTPNFVYPVSGEIGMYGVIDTFIDLNESRPLAQVGLDVKALESKAPLFGDTLEFTTILSASATPSVTLTAAGARTGLGDNTNFAPMIKRTDKHRVIIGLSLPSPSADSDKKEASDGKSKKSRMSINPQFRNHRAFSAPFTVPQISTQSATSAKERALDVARDQLLLNFYNRNLR